MKGDMTMMVRAESGLTMMMDASAMIELGWEPGQTITDDQVFEGIAANGRAFCRVIEAGGHGIDTTELAAMCGHTKTR